MKYMIIVKVVNGSLINMYKIKLTVRWEDDGIEQELNHEVGETEMENAVDEATAILNSFQRYIDRQKTILTD